LPADIADYRRFPRTLSESGFIEFYDLQNFLKKPKKNVMLVYRPSGKFSITINLPIPKFGKGFLTIVSPFQNLERAS